MSFPGPKWSYPTKDQVADYLADLRRAVRRCRCGTGSGSSGWSSCTGATRSGSEPRRSPPTTSSWPPERSAGHRMSPSSPWIWIRPSDSCTPASTAARPTPARSGPGRRRLSLGHRYRLRAGAHASDDPLAGRDLGAAAGPARSLERAAVLAGVLVHGQPRVDPADAHGAQRDGRDPVPRRSGPPAQARRPAPVGCERVVDRVTGVAERAAADRRTGRLDVANVVWCTGFRQVFDWIDLPIFGADGWPREMRGVVGGRPPACSSAGWPSSTRSARWSCRGSGRDAGVRRPPDHPRAERKSVAA